MTNLPLRLALQELRHGWRHFTVFLACLLLGTAVMGGVGILGGTIEHALHDEAQSLLGGDAEITLTGREMEQEQRAFIEGYGRVSHVTTLRSMLQHDGLPVLVEVKAVDAAYPLLGDFKVGDGQDYDVALKQGLIVDESLLAQLDLSIGDTVTLGYARYPILATVKKEPDRAVQLFSFGPRVLMSHEALSRAGIAAAGSLTRQHYRVALNEPQQRDAFVQALNSAFPNAAWRIQTGTDGNEMLERFLNQLLGFLTLSGLATFLISGIGISSSVRAYLNQKLDTVAILKIQGAARRTVLHIYVLVLGFLTLVGGLAGIIIAALAAELLLPLLTAWLPILENVTTDFGSAWLALWYAFLIVYLFSLPALFAALSIRPAILFRSRIAPLTLRFTPTLWAIEIALFALLCGTLLVTSEDKLLITGALGVIALAAVLFSGLVLAIKTAARRITVQKPWMRLALSNLYRPGSTAGTVVFAIGISLTVLLALVLTEANFQARITRIVEERAPSLFLIDIQPHQREGLQALLTDAAGSDHIMVYPMIRGRIVALNGKSVTEEDVSEDVRWAIRGDRGLSYSATPPKNATLAQGQWWSEDYKGSPLVSLDERFLAGMGLDLGDTITIDVLGQKVEAAVASSRRIDYTTFQINFSMMMSPGVIDDFPQTYIATVHLPNAGEQETSLVRRIAGEFPGVTIIRTSQAVALVRDIMEHVATALRVTVLISIVAGILVLASALGAMIRQRLYDTVVLKVLGARRRDILRICTFEWMTLAAATAFIAAALGTLGAWLILLRLRGDEFSFMPQMTLATIGFCMAVIWLTGYAGNRQLFHLKPSRFLRNE